LARYLDRGQIEIRDSRQWYLRGGHFDADRVFGQWVQKEKESLDSGYQGLRCTGDTAWLEKRDWPEFMAYEAEVNRVMPQHRMIGLCTYSLDGCPSDAVLEVVRNHRFALGLTDVIPNAQAGAETWASEQLHRLSVHLLEQHDEERRWIATQLHEMTAQNIAAISVYLASLQQRRSWGSGAEFTLAKCRSLCEQSLEQILALSHLLHPAVLDGLGLVACLRQYIAVFMKRSRIHVEFETGPEIGRLPPETETHLFRVAQEGLSNLLRHSGSLAVIVRLNRHADHVILQIEDSGPGITATATAAASHGDEAGLGILGMQQRLRKIGGRLEIQSSDEGTMLTASVRLS
jgi:signal transduction histidine kinase